MREVGIILKKYKLVYHILNMVRICKATYCTSEYQIKKTAIMIII